MAKYRKRPIVIEARQFTSDPASGVGLALWAGGEWQPGLGLLFIHTREGMMRADMGDWIIQGIAGEFYPCKDSIFRATYEPVED